MKVKLLKGGKWALGGTNVVEMFPGTIKDYGSSDNELLVASGWAEYDNALDVKSSPREVDINLTFYSGDDEIDWLEVFAALKEEEFTTTGKPRVAAVEKIVGRDLKASEVKAAWDEHNG